MRTDEPNEALGVRFVLPRSGVTVLAPRRHDRSARLAVHRLKYHADPAASVALAASMVPLVPASAALLVPIPRARWRLVRHGIDPAAELSRRLAKRLGVPVGRLLRPGFYWPAHAGRSRADRQGTARFRASRASPPAAGTVVLVDDVVTTGATVGVAVDVLDAAWPGLASRITVVAATVA